MLTIWGSQYGRFRHGIARRNFLKIGALGGLTLADALRAEALASPADAKPESEGRHKSVIMLWMGGGPSQLDTYDLKPGAPLEYRGEFLPIHTNVPGIDISEIFPRQAAMMDKLTIIRSLTCTAPNGHGDAELVTGMCDVESQRAKRPSMGALVSKLRGSTETGIPPFVSLKRLDVPIAYDWAERDLDPGFLGPAYRPFIPDGPGMANLTLAEGINLDRLETRKRLLNQFDRLRRDIDASGNIIGMDAFQRQAMEIIVSPKLRDALDLTQEPPGTLERYGGKHAATMLMARRLVEAGVGFVSCLAPGDWDTHFDNFNLLRTIGPRFDQAFAALIQDLHDRGLERDVIVIAWGEFGRTPRISVQAGQTLAGRDHWLPAMCGVISGGGLKMGQVIGSTDRLAQRPDNRPLKISHVLSTIYRAIGIDPGLVLADQLGRPVRVIDEKPISELL